MTYTITTSTNEIFTVEGTRIRSTPLAIRRAFGRWYLDHIPTGKNMIAAKTRRGAAGFAKLLVKLVPMVVLESEVVRTWLSLPSNTMQRIMAAVEKASK